MNDTAPRTMPLMCNRAECGTTLKDHGFKRGDIVMYHDLVKSTGGILYRIVEDNPHVCAEYKHMTKLIKSKRYNYNTSSYEEYTRNRTESGWFNVNGKKVMECAVYGYVRISPVFTFFPTSKGKKPKGKNSTIIITYNRLVNELKRVDVVELGTKYVELGNMIREIATSRAND